MRRLDWVKALRETVEAHRDVPFEWGQHDCCLFTARCYDAVHGTQMTQTLQAAYQDQRSALSYIARFGSLESAVSSHLGQPQKMALTKRGQACLVPTQLGDGLGICIGSTVAVALEPKGYVLYPYSKILKSWPDP